MYFIIFYINEFFRARQPAQSPNSAEKSLKNHKKVLTNVKQDTIIQRNSTVKCEEQDMTSS